MTQYKLNNLSSFRLCAPLVWSGLERSCDIGAKFIIQLILARLLGPEAFGVIALVLVFTTVGVGLMDAGLTQVIIQRESVSEEELSTVFTANIIFALIITLTIFLTAPYVSAFYGRDELLPVLRMLSFSVLFVGCGRVQLGQLRRAVDFKKIASVTLPVQLISGLISVLLALNGYGVWALVVNVLLIALAEAFGYWIVCRWVPKAKPSFSSFRKMIPFGMHMACVRVINLIGENAIFIVIGRVHPLVQVGYLQRANSVRLLTANTLSIAIERVIFPFFSRLQNNDFVLKNLYFKTFIVKGFVLATFAALLSANAENVITLLLGSDWLQSAVYLKILCVYSILYGLHRVVLVRLKAQAKGSQLVVISALENILILVGLWVAIGYGIEQCLWSMCVASLVSLLIKIVCLKRWYGYSVVLHLCATISALLIFGLFCFIINSLVLVHNLKDWVEIAVSLGVIIFMASVILCGVVIFFPHTRLNFMRKYS